MFGKAKKLNSNVWKRQDPQFQCLEKAKSSIPRFVKAQNLNCNVWKAKFLNSKVQKSTNPNSNI